METAASRVLVVADDALFARVGQVLGDGSVRDDEIIQVTDPAGLESCCLEIPPGRSLVVVTALETGALTATQVLACLQRNGKADTPLVLIAQTGTEPEALRCLEQGAEPLVLDSPGTLPRLATLIPVLLKRAEQRRAQRTLAEELQAARDRYLDVFDNTSDLIQCLAPDGRFLYTNRAWRETMGYTEEEVRGLYLRDVLHPDSLACCLDRFEQLKAGEHLHKIDFKFLSKSGETVHLEGDCGSIFKEGAAVSTRGIFRNITDTVQARRACELSEARYRTLYENAPDIYSIINTEGRFESINETGARMLGYRAEELIGRPAVDVIHPEDRDWVADYIGQRFRAPEEGNGIQYRKRTRDGRILWVHQRVSLDPDTETPRLFVLCRDITEQREMQKKLAYQATHDELTKLINRREFDARLQRLLSAERQADEHHVLCYLDLDQFKVINDTCGHIAGDELLRQVARLLSGQIRSRDTLARLGGDEFAILMEHCPLEQARVLANRIREKVEDYRFQWKSRRFGIGVSIGVVPVLPARSVDDVMNHADSACYEAKQLGRNRVHVLSPGDECRSGKYGDGHWASRITEAMDQSGFTLHAQEIVSCRRGDSGRQLEILLRLQDSDTLINPGAFMPVAERYNLASRLDQWVLNATLEWFEQHPEDLAELALCSINLSALSLCDVNFRDYALQRIEQSRVPPRSLCFEVTETAAISNMAQATEFMLALRRQGCKLALDDFGSGLSSLAYLKELPVDIVKIDGSFIRNIRHSEVDKAMVRSICDIARMMDMRTIAEYVESNEAMETVTQIGVDYAQGFHVAQPVALQTWSDKRHEANVIHLKR